MTCTYCGYVIPDDSTTCPVCGGTISEVSVPGGRKKRRSGRAGSKKGLLILSIILAVLLAAVGVTVFALTHTAKGTLNTALLRMVNAFSDSVEEKTGLETSSSLLRKSMASGTYSAALNWSDGESSISADYDYSRVLKKISGEMQINGENLNGINLNFSLDSRNAEFAFPDRSLNVYGFKYSKLRNSVILSALEELLPVNLDSFSSDILFKTPELTDLLRYTAGGRIWKLVDACKVTRLDKRSISVAGEMQTCRVYQVRLKGNTADNGFLKLLQSDVLCYVNKAGQLVAADFVVGNTEYVLTLNGTDNIWDSITLTPLTSAGEGKTFTGGLTETAGVLSLRLGDGENDLFNLTYDKMTGDFSLTVQNAQIISGNLISADDEFTLSFYLDGGDSSQQILQLSMTEMKNTPVKLAKKYINLLDLNLSDFQRLGIDLGM